jgi:uncharacterized protein
MKTKILFLAFLFLPIIAHAETEIPRISVTGNAKKEVLPDEMNWSLFIQHRDKNLSDLASKHASSTANIVSVIKDSGILSAKIKTTQMSFNEEWDYSGTQRFKNGYTASTSVSFTLNDFSKYLKLWQKLSEYPEVSVNGVNFSHSEYETIQNEIKSAALLNAKNKASKMAETLGVRLGQVIYIGDNSEPIVHPVNYQMRESRMDMMAKSSVGGASPVEPGMIKIDSDVRVDFRIIGE